MKKSFLIIVLTLALSLPTFAFSAHVMKEGSIQGFMRFCEGQYTCSPQEEFIVAALEDIFILLDDEGNGYLLPNIKRSLPSIRVSPAILTRLFTTCRSKDRLMLGSR